MTLIDLLKNKFEDNGTETKNDEEEEHHPEIRERENFFGKLKENLSRKPEKTMNQKN